MIHTRYQVRGTWYLVSIMDVAYWYSSQYRYTCGICIPQQQIVQRYQGMHYELRTRSICPRWHVATQPGYEYCSTATHPHPPPTHSPINPRTHQLTAVRTSRLVPICRPIHTHHTPHTNTPTDPPSHPPTTHVPVRVNATYVHIIPGRLFCSVLFFSGL